MSEYALKEWAVTIAALAAGDQVLIVRKGGIGEKRFELPHPRFYLFPTYAHQRPELLEGRLAVQRHGLIRADPPAVGGAGEDGVGHGVRGYQGLPSP